MSFELAIVLMILVNSIAALRYKKRIRLRNIIILVFLFLFLSSIREGPDINNYILLFQSDYIYKDQGFAVFSRWFYKLGWTYYQFQSFVYAISLSLIAQGLLRRFERRTMIYILFFFYPLPLNAVQIRNMLSCAILIYAFCICYDYRERMVGKIVWSILLAVSAVFHVIMIVFIPFIFIWNKQKVMSVGLKVITGVVIALYVAPSNIINFMTRIATYFADATRVSSYMVRSTRMGGLVMITLAVFYYLISRFARESSKHIISKQNSFGKETESNLFLEYVESLLKYSLFFTPLYVLNGNFTRLMQNESILIYGSFLTCLYAFKTSKKQGLTDVYLRNRKILVYALCCSAFMYNIFFLWWGQWSTIIVPIFSRFLSFS